MKACQTASRIATRPSTRPSEQERNHLPPGGRNDLSLIMVLADLPLQAEERAQGDVHEESSRMAIEACH
jgi:hypothetical protein